MKQTKCYYNADNANWAENYRKGIKLPTHRKATTVIKPPPIQVVEHVVEQVVEEPVVEPKVETKVEETVQQTKVDSVIPTVAEEGPIYIYMNDKFHENLFNRIDELGIKVPQDGLNWLHHPERMKFTKEEMKDPDAVSLTSLAIQLRTVMFNAYTYNVMLADYLHARKIASQDIRKLFMASIAHHSRLVKTINDDCWKAIVNHLINFLLDKHILHDNGHINDIPSYDYEYALKHLNESGCGMDYGSVSRHLVRKKVDTKVLTAASADHRQRPAKEYAEHLEKMNIVEFYKEWKTLTTDKKKRLTMIYGLTIKEPKNIEDVDALWNNKLISKATYYNYKNKLNKEVNDE